MPQNSSTKNKELQMEKIIFPILAVNNKLKPYIEVFNYQPENITQQPLGILAGFFEIREYTEDSAYIVNFLNSVAKKEYYLNPKRSVPESFDCALHKINIALSEVAKHGNVNWLGKLDSAICAFEKNSIHFTVTGNAQIFLWRKGILTNIAEDLSSEIIDPHPLKTFTNVSSGRLEKNDRVIITSGDILNILSPSDIQKNIARFDNDKFCQFLKTAISNELDVAGAIVVDIKEPEKIKKKAILKIQTKKEPVNVFSGESFIKKENKATAAIKTNNKKESLLKDNVTDDKEYTDEKTGHIYIQGEENKEDEISLISEKIQIIKDILSDVVYSIKIFILKQISNVWKKIKFVFSIIKNYKYSEKLSSLKSSVNKRYTRDDITDKAVIRKVTAEKKYPESQLVNNDKDETSFSMVENYHSIVFKIKLWFKKYRVRSSTKKSSPIEKTYSSEKIKITPSIEKIKQLFSRFSIRHRIYAVGLICIIIVTPFVFSKITSNQEKIETIQQTEIIQELTEEEIYSEEINISFIKQIEKISSIENGVAIFSLEDSLFTVTDKNVISLEAKENNEFAWPEEYGEGIAATYMADLGKIFIATNNRSVISFSPVSKKFEDNTISLPDNINIELLSTYLTYLYIADRSSNEIYRYPRAEGGFGEKSNWLRQNIDLSNATSMSIDENLYISFGNSLEKYFQGKKEAFTVTNTKTPISFDIVYTNIDLSNIYILDKLNSRIVVIGKDGSIIAQYHNDSIKSSIGFSVDERSDKAFILTEDEVDSLSL